MGMRSSSSSGCTDPGTMAVMPTSANSRELAARECLVDLRGNDVGFELTRAAARPLGERIAKPRPGEILQILRKQLGVAGIAKLVFVQDAGKSRRGEAE